VYRQDAYFSPLVAEDRARILAQGGEAEAALDEIERLPSGARVWGGIVAGSSGGKTAVL
jgi:hypothetical protein